MNASLPFAALRATYTVGEPLTLRVHGIRWEAEGIHAFELVHPEGIGLPEVEAGAHVDVHLPGGGRQVLLAGGRSRRSQPLDARGIARSERPGRVPRHA